MCKRFRLQSYESRPHLWTQPLLLSVTVVLMPQLQQDMDTDSIFQQNGAPAFPTRRYSCLNRTVLAWIGRGGTIAWSPRSTDLTLLEFSIWGYVKDKVFVPLLPASLEELRVRITEAVASIDADVIHRIWDEVAYTWDISRLRRGNYTEHL